MGQFENVEGKISKIFLKKGRNRISENFEMLKTAQGKI